MRAGVPGFEDLSQSSMLQILSGSFMAEWLRSGVSRLVTDPFRGTFPPGDELIPFTQHEQADRRASRPTDPPDNKTRAHRVVQAARAGMFQADKFFDGRIHRDGFES